MKIIKENDLSGKLVSNALVNADCLKALPLIPDQSVDMVLTDLPYGVTNIHWDNVIPMDTMWREFERVAKKNAAMVFTATQPFTTELIYSKKQWFKYEMIWVKNKSTGHLNAKKMPMKNHENILVFYQKQPTYNPQMSQGHDPLHYAINKNQTKLYGKYGGVESRTGATDRYPKSVVNFDVVNQESSIRIHENQKPVDMFSYLIKMFTNEGETVLDICAGSCTTAFAALNTKRKYICIEKEQDYIEKASNLLRGSIFD